MIIRATCPVCFISTRIEEGQPYQMCGHKEAYVFETDDGDPVTITEVIQVGAPDAT